MLSAIHELKKLHAQDPKAPIPNITLYEKRTEDEFCARPQLIIVDGNTIDEIMKLVSEKSRKEFLEEHPRDGARNIFTLHIGELQKFLYICYQEQKASADEIIKNAVSIEFGKDMTVLDLSTGVIRDSKSGAVETYSHIVTANGDTSKTQRLLTQHDQPKYVEHERQEPLETQASVLFFLKNTDYGTNFSRPIFDGFTEEDRGFLKSLGWEEQRFPAIVAQEKETANGRVISMGGEFPATYNKQDIEKIKEWMRAILERKLSQKHNKGSLQYLKFMEPTDDPSLKSYTKKELLATTFPIYVQYSQKASYKEEGPGLRESTATIIGDAAASANPHSSTGAIVAMLSGLIAGKELAGTAKASDVEAAYAAYRRVVDTVLSMIPRLGPRKPVTATSDSDVKNARQKPEEHLWTYIEFYGLIDQILKTKNSQIEDPDKIIDPILRGCLEENEQLRFTASEARTTCAAMLILEITERYKTEYLEKYLKDNISTDFTTVLSDILNTKIPAPPLTKARIHQFTAYHKVLTLLQVMRNSESINELSKDTRAFIQKNQSKIDQKATEFITAAPPPVIPPPPPKNKKTTGTLE